MSKRRSYFYAIALINNCFIWGSFKHNSLVVVPFKAEMQAFLRREDFLHLSDFNLVYRCSHVTVISIF